MATRRRLMGRRLDRSGSLDGTGAVSAGDLARLAAIVRDLPPVRLAAWLRCGRRIAEGMPVAEAEALMWADVAADATPKRRRPKR